MAAAQFYYSPSQWVPFRDTSVLERVRRIKRSDIEKHQNPNFTIKVLPALEIRNVFVADMFYRIQLSAQRGERLVLILPNPAPEYRDLANLINRFEVNCEHVYFFAMDEYANEDGDIAPESWPYSFKHAMLKYLYEPIREDLRPPRKQIIGPTNENFSDYGRMITDLGEADACYSGPGWTGHLAFIEPDAPEFQAELNEWKTFGPRITTLSPFTLAQNSLHGSFGMSGDLALVPPKAATIGPAQVIAAKFRMDMCAITVHGTSTAWQRLIVRLAAHGPVTPLVPTSIHQILESTMYISEEIARDIEPKWDKGY
jgi:6-phosphogluconolactonase/glucosamine-6-phosphate isomerase/deaminase